MVIPILARWHIYIESAPGEKIFLSMFYVNIQLKALPHSDCKSYEQKREMGSDHQSLTNVWNAKWSPNLTNNCLLNTYVSQCLTTMDGIISYLIRSIFQMIHVARFVVNLQFM